MGKNRLFWIGMTLLIFGGSALTWSYLPVPPVIYTTTLRWSDILTESIQNSEKTEPQSTMSANQPENTIRSITSLPSILMISVPPRIHFGDHGEINLRIVKEKNKLSDRSKIFPQENKFSGERPQILIEADLDLSNMDIAPAPQIRQILGDDGEIHFRWDVYPRIDGVHDGLLWVYAYLDNGEAQQENRLILSAKHFTIKSDRIFGLAMPAVRWLGFGGVLLGVFILIGIQMKGSIQMPSPFSKK